MNLSITCVFWSAGTSNVGISGTSFLGLIETLMTNYCKFPCLGFSSSWFWLQYCAPISAKSLRLMPNITIPFTPLVSITLTAGGYVILFCVVRILSTDASPTFFPISLPRNGMRLPVGKVCRLELGYSVRKKLTSYWNRTSMCPSGVWT